MCDFSVSLFKSRITSAALWGIWLWKMQKLCLKDQLTKITKLVIVEVTHVEALNNNNEKAEDDGLEL